MLTGKVNYGFRLRVGFRGDGVCANVHICLCQLVRQLSVCQFQHRVALVFVGACNLHLFPLLLQGGGTSKMPDMKETTLPIQ